MIYYSKVVEGVVENIIVVESREFFDTFVDDSPGEWLQTSNNTIGGIQYDEDVIPTDISTIRKNTGNIGYVYSSARDAFIAPKPYPSWVLDEDTCIYEAPIAYPTDDLMYDWNEETLAWIETIQAV